eukprot:1291090-Pyramimonas_sp.AAC.1
MWTSGAPRGTLWTGAAPSRLSSGTPRASAGTCLENNTNHQPAQVCACDAIVWTLRAIVWTLRAIVWTLRVIVWTLRALVRLLHSVLQPDARVA